MKRTGKVCTPRGSPTGRRSRPKVAARAATRHSHRHLDLEDQNRALVESQLELELSRDRYAEFYDAAPVCFVGLNRVGMIVEINLPATQLLGRRRHELVGAPFIALVQKRDRRDFLRYLAGCRRGYDPHHPHRIELRLAKRDGAPGTSIEINTSLAGSRKDASPIAFHCVFTDISVRKQSEDMLARMGAAVASSEDAILAVDRMGCVLIWNQGAERMYGLPAAQAIGRPFSELLSADEGTKVGKMLWDIVRGGRSVNYEASRRGKDDSVTEVAVTVSPVKDASGRILGASYIARDISAKKAAELELLAARDEAERANKSKDDFLAALSHELRTPLNPVLLIASDAASDPALSGEVRENFEMIRRNIELEAKLIDDLLDLTRITRNKVTLERKPLHLFDLVRDAIQVIQGEAEEKRIEIATELSSRRDMVLGDAVRLRQVIWNLLKNSIKFTPAGGKVRVGAAEQADTISISVTDNGIGMVPDELAGIFEPFFQGHHAGRDGPRSFGGLGLGLAISAKLAQAHGGWIKATSSGKDLGSTVTVTLPLTPEKEAPKAKTRALVAEPAVSTLRILVVEDHEPTRAALVQVLTRRHHEVLCASSVREARKVAAGRPLDLLITDIGLPDGSGYDLFDELGQKAKIMGIALTGYGMEMDRNRSASAGFGCHLTKPVSAVALEAALAQVTSPPPMIPISESRRAGR